jgi:hypothetical protein
LDGAAEELLVAGLPCRQRNRAGCQPRSPKLLFSALTEFEQQTQFWRGTLHAQKNPYLEDKFFAALRAKKAQPASAPAADSAEASK